MRKLASILGATTTALVFSAACGSSDPAATGGGGASSSSSSSSSSSGSQGGGGGQPTLIDTDKGPVSGFSDGVVRSFLGIPYAAPPVGPLRWKPPQPHDAWATPLIADKKGVYCPQLAAIGSAPMSGTSEDCLTLNVWAPGNGVVGPAPVLVWIHGGGFTIGSGSELTYDGYNLAKATGAMVVTINYRLGPLGFLAHSALASEDPNHPSSGMYGFEDQRAALAWVKANAAKFNGDPSNVTVFGESAGGISTCLHVLSPKSAGLFQRAIVESGPCGLSGGTEKSAEVQGDAFAAALGCTGAGALDCMRGKAPDELITALPGKPGEIGVGGAAWLPVVDGVNLPDQPGKMLTDGNFNKVPVLLGTNEDEGTIFFKIGVSVGSDADFAALMDGLFDNQSAAILAYYTYPSAAYADVQAAATAAIGDGLFTCPTRRTARAFAKSGQAIHMYHFENAPPTLLGDLGAFHSAEVPFIFQNPYIGIKLDDAQTALSTTMIGYWNRMAQKGDPNGGGAPAWPAYTEASDEHLVLDLTIKGGSGLRKAECDFWDTLGGP